MSVHIRMIIGRNTPRQQEMVDKMTSIKKSFTDKIIEKLKEKKWYVISVFNNKWDPDDWDIQVYANSNGSEDSELQITGYNFEVEVPTENSPKCGKHKKFYNIYPHGICLESKEKLLE